MPITPTNRTKNTITPRNESKTGIATWGDSLYTWGDIGAYWGTNYSITNEVKHTPASTTTVVGSPIGLLLLLTHATAITTGSGWSNKTKS